MKLNRLSTWLVLGMILLSGSQAWSAASSPQVVIKQGRIAMEAFTGGKRFLMEGRDNGMPFRIFLPSEAFSTGGIFNPSSYATLPEDATNSISTQDYLYFYVNDEGTAPNFIAETGATLVLFFSDFSLRDSVLHVTMEYKILAPAGIGFPLNRVEVYPTPHEVNPNASATPASAGTTIHLPNSVSTASLATPIQRADSALSPNSPGAANQGTPSTSNTPNSATGSNISSAETPPERSAGSADSNSSAATGSAPASQTASSAVGRAGGCSLSSGPEVPTWGFLLFAQAGILGALAVRFI